MNREEIRNFFDDLADGWDRHMIRNEEVIRTILDNAHVGQGSDVLDVACGTGVLIPDYLSRNVNSVTGIDISGKMAQIADRKFIKDPRVRIICGDVLEYPFRRHYDSIVVYNAAPHFPDPEELIRILAQRLKQGGCLTIAHGMSWQALRKHHENVSSVSRLLPEADQLAAIMQRYVQVETVISDARMYQVAGINRKTDK